MTNPFEINEDMECLGHINALSLGSGEYIIRENMVYRKKQEPIPKYKVGDKVFLLKDNTFFSFKIDEIIDDNGFWYVHSHNYGCLFDQYPEDILYPTKASLITAQIEHWQSLLDVEEKSLLLKVPYEEDRTKCKHEYKKTLATSGMYFINMCHKCHDMKPCDECKHEDDGMVYCSNPPQNKCKKCGEFYI